jgi:hypothetical protein
VSTNRCHRPGPWLSSTGWMESLEARTLMFAWSPEEVYLEELVNRARQDPAAEQVRLNATRAGDDPVTDLTQGLTSAELARLVPQEPLSLNQYLTVAARAHSLDMAQRDFFDHVNPDGLDPTDRAQAAGYTGSAGENIAAGYRSIDASHRAWINSLGHRKNVFSLHSNFSDSFHYDELGVGFAFTDIGPFFDYYTEEFGVQADPSVKFILGVVFDDRDHDNFYTIGEGSSQVRIDVTRAADPTNVVGTYTTDAAGNYQIPLGPGSFIVTFTRLATGKVFAEPVTVSTVNVKRDAHLDQIVNTPGSPEVPTDDHPNAGAFLSADTIAITPSSGDGAAQGFVNPASDTDLFRFVPVATGSLTIRVVSITNGMDVYARLFGATGNPLEISFDEVGDASNAEIDFNVVAGQTYFVQVELQAPTATTGQYVLTIDGLPTGQDDDGSGGPGGGGDDGGDGGDGSVPDGPGGGGGGGDARERFRVDRQSPDAFLSGSVDASGHITLTALNQLGRPVLLKQNDQGGGDWSGQDFLATAGGPDISGQPVTWTDPKDNRSYAAARSRSALILYTQASDGTWTVRNLTVEIPGAARIDLSPTVFISTDGIVSIAGLTDSGDLVIYSQTGARDGSGNYAWSFADITQRDLAPLGATTPRFAGDLISYVTAWNGMNIAGLDDTGQIQVVWWAPGLSHWQTSNLSQITGAPTLSGGLTAYLTSWQGINIAGVDQDGRLRVTWWVPQFEGNWQNNDLTAQFDGPTLSGGTVASYVTSWGGLNVVGLDDTGKLVAYWWAPAIEGGQWQVTNLSDTVTDPPALSGRLTGVPFGDGISVVGFDADGDVVRYHWSAASGQWQAEDVTGMVVT